MRNTTLVITRRAQIDAAAVAQRDVDTLTRDTLRAARRFFARPDVQADFAVWLARQQAAGRFLEEGGAEG